MDTTTTIRMPALLTAITDRIGSWAAYLSARAHGSMAGAAGAITDGAGVMKAGAAESVRVGDVAIMAAASRDVVLRDVVLQDVDMPVADSRATAMRGVGLPAVGLMVGSTAEAAFMVEEDSTEAADFIAAVAGSTAVSVVVSTVAEVDANAHPGSGSPTEGEDVACN